MKYLKTYENKINPRLDELKKLLSHLAEMFKELGYYHLPKYDEYQYANNFFTDISTMFGHGPNNGQNCFDINGEFSNSLIFLCITMRIASIDDDLVKFIPEYLKTINGLKLYSENPSFFNTQFQVVDNVDNIIYQISIDDFKKKLQSKKYNI
jgi:hypothetical protein